MININITTLLPAVFAQSLFLFLLIFFKKFISTYFLVQKYDAEQKIHSGEVFRFGGLSLMIFFFFADIFYYRETFFSNIIILSFLPLAFIGLIEDLFHNTSAKLRLCVIFLTAFTFFYLLDSSFPRIDFPPLQFLFNNEIFLYIFFVFSISVVVNGFNFIDGINGLATISTISVFTCILLLSVKFDDLSFANDIIILLIPFVIFFFVNYPLGKVFLGDLGSYLGGYIVASIIILFFTRHPEIKTWGAILLLFYPSFEVLFSFLRKLYNKKSPLSADLNHLHTLLFFYIYSYTGNKLLSNSAAIFPLAFFWLLPSIIFYFYYNNLSIIILSIFFEIICYFVFYIILIKYKLRNI